MVPRIPPKPGFEYEKEPKPKNLKEVPKYISKTLGDFFKRYFYIFKLVYKSGKWICFTLFAIAILDAGLPILTSWFTKEIMNSFQKMAVNSGFQISDFLSSSVFYLFIFLFLFKILLSITGTINDCVTRIAGDLVIKQVKLSIMEKTKTTDLSAYDMPSFYEKLENANREAGSRPVQILWASFEIVSKIFVLIFYFTVLVSKFPIVTLLLILLYIPTGLISFYFRKKNFDYIRERSVDRQKMNYYSNTIVNKDLVKEFKIFDLSDTFIGNFNRTFKEYYKGIKSLLLKESVISSISTIITSTISCAFYVVIGFSVFNGGILIGDYSFYTNALGTSALAITRIISLSSTIFEGTLFVDNLISFINEKPKITSPSLALDIEYGKPHTIEFKNVSFKYPESDRYVLKDINVVINSGETLSLVGLNGAGKTTFIKLLTRLYDPSEGEILLDGNNLKSYDLKSLYKLYGIIFQDFGKYAFTVSENIAFGDINAKFDIDRIKESAKMSNSDEFISLLEKQYDTNLMKYFDKNGTELSIGQWQKLSIARAFYSDSDILILDEPTASLDAIAEAEIYKQFDSLRKNKTTVFVSHRLSSAVIASKIIVLENGQIIEEGTHKSLMESKGKYYKLFSTQAERYLEQ